jgi:hypothetical protein
MAQADLHIDASTPGEIARSNTASPAAFRWIPSMVKCSGMAGKAIKPAPASGELRQDRVAAVDRRAALAFIATAL